jgi:tetratricopeptide (TPR) repeat protein
MRPIRGFYDAARQGKNRELKYLHRMRTLCVGVLLGTLLCRQTGAAPDSTATAHIGKGYELVQSDRYREAAEEFRKALALDPGAIKARYQLAVCLLALGERAESRKEFERLRTTTDNDPAVAYYLARLDLLDGDAAAAIRRLVAVMDHAPFPDAAFYLGSAYLAHGDLDEAIRWLRKAAQAAPHDFRAHYRLARILRQKGLDTEAEQEYTRSTEMREHYNESARQSVACVQALHTDTAGAAAEICDRLFDPNDPDKLTTLGMLYGENGRYEESLKPLRRAAELDPDSFEVYHNLGVTYFRLRRFPEARGPLERAVSLRPDYFGSNALLGATLYSLKDDEAAWRVLHFAHQLKPADGDTTELLFRESVILGNRAAAAGDYPAGLKYLLQASDLRPGNLELQSRIAEIKNLAPPTR